MRRLIIAGACVSRFAFAQAAEPATRAPEHMTLEESEEPLHGTSTADDDDGCVPSCRTGFVCVAGKCISACNPPCRGGERCLRGDCVRETAPIYDDPADDRFDAPTHHDPVDDGLDASTPSRPGVHRHDGLYVRMGIGLGAGSYGGTLISPRQDENGSPINAYGFVIPTELAIGGTVSPGLVIGGVVSGDSFLFLHSRYEYQGRTLVSDGGSAGMSSIGPFVDFYFDPKGGWHLQAAVGLGAFVTAKSADTGACNVPVKASISSTWPSGFFGKVDVHRPAARARSFEMTWLASIVRSAFASSNPQFGDPKISGMSDDPVTPRIEFSYWSDPLCIWALVAQTKLDRLLADLGTHLVVDYRIVPVFGSVHWRFTEGPWAKEGLDGRVAATRRIAENGGRMDVTGECWRKAAPASSWAPASAIKAVFAMEAGAEVPAGSGARYQCALREWFFVNEENIARRDVQLSVAEAESVPRASIERQLDDGSALAAVWEDHNEKERLRIQGSPTYVFDGGRAMLYGNFDYGMLRSTVEELVRGSHPGSSAC